ncbi:unnamed protein product [Phaeothamnion confervicola]
MKDILATPTRALGAGFAIAAVGLVVWLVGAGADRISLLSFAVRWVHIASAIVWLGMIWFVNFIQLVALAEADQPGRAAILKHIVPRVAATFRHASHLTIASGAMLLVTSGYMMGSVVYGAPVSLAAPRNILMWTGTLGAMAMYMFVHMMIWPALRLVLGIDKGDAETVAAARLRVLAYARWNLVLAVPVSVAMVAAAHLY